MIKPIARILPINVLPLHIVLTQPAIAIALRNTKITLFELNTLPPFYNCPVIPKKIIAITAMAEEITQIQKANLSLVDEATKITASSRIKIN